MYFDILKKKNKFFEMVMVDHECLLGSRFLTVIFPFTPSLRNL